MSPRARKSVPLMVLGLFLWACEGSGPIEPNRGAPTLDGPRAALVESVPDVCGQESTSLLAGQVIDVGTVRVSNDEETLYVTFETGGGWAMTETQVAVAATPEDLPRRGDRVVHGLFPDRAVHDPPVTTVHYAVPLTALGGQDIAVVAAHADVVLGAMAEGAWATGTELDQGGGWGSYVSYAIADCGEDVVVVIGDEGGEVPLGEAGLLTVEPGALGEDVEITASPVPEADLPPGVLPGTAFDFGPDGLAFDPPAILMLRYDATGLSAAQEAALAIHLLSPEGDLEALPSTVDVGAKTVTAQVSHFSVYAIPTPFGTVRINAPDAANEGGTLQHVVEFVNLTDVAIPATDVIVELTVDGAVTPASSPPECTLDSPPGAPLHYTCAPVVDVPGMGGWGLTFVHDLDAGSALSVVTALTSYSYATPGGSILAGTLPVATTNVLPPLLQADLSVGITPPDGLIVAGAPVDFTVGVRNIGPAGVETARLTLQIRVDVPKPLTVDALVGASFSECTTTELYNPFFEGLEVECAIAEMGLGANFDLTVTITVGSAGPIELWATAVDEGTTDPFPDNDTATESFFVNP